MNYIDYVKQELENNDPQVINIGHTRIGRCDIIATQYKNYFYYMGLYDEYPKEEVGKINEEIVKLIRNKIIENDYNVKKCQKIE